jgi:hypothetical protein
MAIRHTVTRSDDMFETKKGILAMILGAAAAACGGGGGDASHGETEAATPPDFRRAFSAEGLTIETSAPLHVAGRFARHGATIIFDLAQEGEGRHLRVESASGQPILDSTLARGVDSATYLGGKAHAEGPSQGEPKLEGDAAAWSELEASAEAQLLPELKEALIAAHVEEDLFRPELAATRAGNVTPKAGYDGYWWHIAPYGDGYGFWSWSWWGVTSVVVAREENPYGECWGVNFYPGASYEHVDGCGMQTIRRRWWGAYVTVTDGMAPLCSLDGTWCQNVNLIVHNY